MRLNSEITADIANAFDTDLSDAVTEFIAIRHVHGTNDWAINDNTGKDEEYQGRGVFGSYNAYEIDGQTVAVHDVKLICLQSEVDEVPLIDDVINDMRVLNVSKDPANVTWVMQLRGLNYGHEVG
ncbi:glutamate 5-kinase [Moraxella sp. ZY200743]|uniref:glutamate 5-kinase n=1 Tax=Moraxella sp. ZY200743 TaxID=2911970 RepID=UPI003D7CF45A